MTEDILKNPDFQIIRVEVIASEPNAGELRKIHARAATAAGQPETTYLVKIYMDALPEPSGTGYELWIGDQQIRKYTQFKGGIFFKVYDLESLGAMDGASIRFRRQGDENFIPLKIEYALRKMSDLLIAPDAAKLKSRRDALAE